MNNELGDGLFIVYFHRGCNDGRLAGTLMARYLNARGKCEVAVCALSPRMDEFYDYARRGDHAVFVDLFPPQVLVNKLENMYKTITVLDHHASPAVLCATLRQRPKWNIMFDASMCGAALVAKYFPCPDIEKFALAVEMTDKYDRWVEPTDEVFAWMFASQIMWDEISEGDGNVMHCVRYAEKLSGATVDSMRKIGEPMFGPLKTAYRRQRPFLLRLAEPCAEWDGMAVAMMRTPALNPSIAGHWLLAEHPQVEVAVVIKVDQNAGATTYSASVRSRTLDTTRFVPGARGHPHASGCTLTQAQMDTGKLIDV